MYSLSFIGPATCTGSHWKESVKSASLRRSEIHLIITRRGGASSQEKHANADASRTHTRASNGVYSKKNLNAIHPFVSEILLRKSRFTIYYILTPHTYLIRIGGNYMHRRPEQTKGARSRWQIARAIFGPRAFVLSRVGWGCIHGARR